MQRHHQNSDRYRTHHPIETSDKYYEVESSELEGEHDEEEGDVGDWDDGEVEGERGGG